MTAPPTKVGGAVTEKYYGKKINKDEVVHHINGIKDDNRISNLIIMSRKKHNKENITLTKICQEQIRFLENKIKNLEVKSHGKLIPFSS